MLILLILLQTLSIAAPDDTFQDANTAYEKGDFENARAAYEALLNGGWVSFEVYYNLGNTYFKLKKIGLAILYYEKALRLNPRDEDATANLELAELRRKDTIVVPPDFVLFAFFRQARDYFSIQVWIGLSLIGWCVVSGVMTIGVIGWWRPPVWFRNGILIVFSCLLAGLLAKSLNERSRIEAVIISPAIDARNEPLEGSSVVFVLHEGTKVQVRSEREDWMEVVLPDGKVGWIRHSDSNKI